MHLKTEKMCQNYLTFIIITFKINFKKAQKGEILNLDLYSVSGPQGFSNRVEPPALFLSL